MHVIVSVSLLHEGLEWEEWKHCVDRCGWKGKTCFVERCGGNVATLTDTNVNIDHCLCFGRRCYVDLCEKSTVETTVLTVVKKSVAFTTVKRVLRWLLRKSAVLTTTKKCCVDYCENYDELTTVCVKITELTVDHCGMLCIFRFKNRFCTHEVGGNTSLLEVDMKREIPKTAQWSPTKNIFSFVDLNKPIYSNQSNLGLNQMYISTVDWRKTWRLSLVFLLSRKNDWWTALFQRRACRHTVVMWEGIRTTVVFIINRESESYRQNLWMNRCDERLKARVEESTCRCLLWINKARA